MRGGIMSRIIDPIVFKVIVALKVVNLSDRLLALTIVWTICNCMSKMVTSMAYYTSAMRWLWGVGASVCRCIVRWWSVGGSGIEVRWAV